MALPSSGTITMGMIKTELSVTGTLTLTDSRVRSLAGKTSGVINMSDLRGKSFVVGITATASPSEIIDWATVINNRPATPSGSTTITTTAPSPTYTWTIETVWGAAPTLSTSNGNRTATIQFSSRFADQRTGWLVCTVASGGSSVQVRVGYELITMVDDGGGQIEF